MWMKYTTLLIDLDETLYPTSTGVWDAISERMERYMHERLNLPLEGISSLRRELYTQYGTTLRGLKATRQVDEHDFMAFVHDIPVDRLLEPDPQLREVLLRYPQQKVIFTNADRNHARRVLSRLQVEDCFDNTIDIFDVSPYCKPMREAFEIALNMCGEKAPERCVFIDDSYRNLSAARALGFHTIRVGVPQPGYPHPDGVSHFRVARFSDLPAVLDPDL